MGVLYSSPLRVYMCCGLLALFGLFSGFKLPVSLFPNSSKPTVVISIPFASLTAQEFAKTYGPLIENRIHSLTDNTIKLETIETTYDAGSARFKIMFDWGVDDKLALKEVETSIHSLGAQFPNEMRDGIQIWTWNDNTGFLAISFYSRTRNLDELYKLIEPTLTPHLTKIKDSNDIGLFNPNSKEIQIELKADTMAALQILPKDIEVAVQSAISSQRGGSITVNTDNLIIQMPRTALTINELGNIPILSRTGQRLHLNDVATIDLRTSQKKARSFKTSGSPSLILFASPAPGGNIKKMAEDVLSVVNDLKNSWPKDVEYKILVDPSEFIRNSIRNVFHEVLTAAALAVIILFLFVGSLRNVATAAIEIPLSIILAFILMRLTGININIISLGGLALSAGMNVDASVVVMENIFRHFENYDGSLNPKKRLEIILNAVNEVKLPVIASTIASVVVFLPLAFTSNLSYAILGDLAKTVVFSHGFSAIVALILVPTIRLQLMSKEKNIQHRSPIEPALKWLENKYSVLLNFFIESKKIQISCYVCLSLTLGLLIWQVLPKLPKEVIGLPDTDWMVVALNTQGNTELRQIEEQTSEIEAKMLKKFGDQIQYTFTQNRGPNRSSILARLKDKSKMQDLWKEFQDFFQNTPYISFFVEPWNPSELPIPDPPDFQLSIYGGTADQRVQTAKTIGDLLQEKKLYSRVYQKPTFNSADDLIIQPHAEQWTTLKQQNYSISLSDLADISRVATEGRRIGDWVINNEKFDIILQFPFVTVKTPEDLASLPIGVNNKIIPFKALADIFHKKSEPSQFRQNQQDLAMVFGRLDNKEKPKTREIAKASKETIENWKKENHDRLEPLTVQVDNAQYELDDALFQLGIAVGLSILLIFVTMVIQLGDLMSSLLVLVSIPLGFIGVLLSLFIFQSTLSLNSALGVILLNGIAVANSIILVDFLNKLVKQGREVKLAALEASRTRLRPILMTSLATGMGMLPIALGFGDGGRILQPLGIAVSGGLFFSTLFTLFIVPSLQVTYLNWKNSLIKKRNNQSEVKWELIT